MMNRATMASFSPKPTKCYNVRSISMPTRSHPTTLRIEEELNKLKSLEASSTSSSSICKGLSGLKDLYTCIEELLQLPLTQKALSLHQNEKWVEELLDGSVRVLRDASMITSLMFQSLLAFLSAPVLKTRTSRWSLVSILMQKGVLVCENSENRSMHEMEGVDIAIGNLFVDDASEEEIESAQRKLEALDESIEGLEDGLDGLFRLLIHTRVSFLNIVSY